MFYKDFSKSKCQLLLNFGNPTSFCELTLLTKLRDHQYVSKSCYCHNFESEVAPSSLGNKWREN